MENMFVNEGVDLINTLPDPLLGVIVSFLPGTEGMRTCVLSQRWKMVWKHAFHLHFDQRKMLRHGQGEINVDAIARSESLINFLLDSHHGPLESCTIQHLAQSCTSGKVVEWIRKLLEEKKVKKLSMEVYKPVYLRSMAHRTRGFIYLGADLDFPFEIFSAFEELELKNYHLKTSPSNYVSTQVLKSLIFNNVIVNNDAWEGILLYCLCLEKLTLEQCKFLSVVKIDNSRLKFFRICRMMVSEIEVSSTNLEVLEIDTVVCSEKFAFDTPKVRVFRSSFDDNNLGGRVHQHNLLQLRNILYTCSSSQTPQGSTSSFASIFKNLLTLSVGLDLKRVKNAAALFSALESCPILRNLEINSQVNNGPWYCNSDGQNENEDDCLPYPKIFFWRRREFCECINHQLKSLSIKGFVGEELEMEFLKYIITTAEVLEKITIWFVDDCSWAQAIATRCLLLFPRASPNLSAILKPGPLYMKNVDENFETWVSTLRVCLDGWKRMEWKRME